MLPMLRLSLVLVRLQMNRNLAAEDDCVFTRKQGQRIGTHGPVRQREEDGVVRPQGLLLHIERGVGEFTGDARAGGKSDPVLHHQPLGLAVEHAAHGAHPRPAAVWML